VSSPSAGEAVLARLGARDRALWLEVPVVVAGRTTAEALAERGASRIVVARAPSEEGLAESLESLASPESLVSPESPSSPAPRRAGPARARAAGAKGGTS
jgi:hypothetical protein